MLGVAISGARIPGDQPAGARVTGVGHGQRRDARTGPAGVAVLRRPAVELLPPLPRAVRPGAHRNSACGTASCAARPGHPRCLAERVQGPQQQPVRQRRRGDRVPLRTEQADDQRPRRGGGERADRESRRQVSCDRGTVVYYNSDVDIAVLDVPELDGPTIGFDL